MSLDSGAPRADTETTSVCFTFTDETTREVQLDTEDRDEHGDGAGAPRGRETNLD